MRILHYSLGFPPFRTGGLTKFCMDLMKEQAKEGNEVALLWPGKLCHGNKKTEVRKKDAEKVGEFIIGSFEVINPLPVSYDEGINNIDVFTDEGEEGVYRNYLTSYMPDVIHIHTLMGLHLAFLKAAKGLGIRLVFTTHDFFPICPKVTLFRNGCICESAKECSICPACNGTALSLKKMRLLQSPLYRKMKDTPLVKKLRKQHRDDYLGERQDAGETVDTILTPGDYIKLRAYYEFMIRLMDIVHYNSNVTKNVYEEYMGDLNCRVIPISHSDIEDRRKKKEFSDELIRIRYLGPYSSLKGFFNIKNALDKLWIEKQTFRLDIHFVFENKPEYIRLHERYAYSELESILDDTDILITPSAGYETFGYTVLEALSYGVPVITTCNVGAKDIIAPGAGIIVNDLSGDELYETIKDLNAGKLREMNDVILSDQIIIRMSDVAKQIEEKCYT